MTKKDFIEKYGEERYRQHCEYCNKQRQGEVVGKTNLKRGRIDSYTRKITMPIPEFQGNNRRSAETELRERIAAELQKAIRREYRQTTLRDHIIVVNDSQYRRNYIFRAELNQLSMTKKEIGNFDVVCENCEKKIKDFVFPKE